MGLPVIQQFKYDAEGGVALPCFFPGLETYSAFAVRIGGDYEPPEAAKPDFRLI